MPRPIAILHGWSDTSKSFQPLASFLRRHGFDAVPLWLGDYLSLDDDVRIEDVAKRMEAVVQQAVADNSLTIPFDLVVHSTGGLVARHWLANYYADGQACPVRRLLMLAPANFGSKLASMGQSLLGRVVKGWNNWFHTGKEMLTALELASAFQWDLAQRDLFMLEEMAAGGSLYGEKGVWPFVIVGSHPYGSKLRQMVNENGADGTVRVAAANLNARGVTVDFAASESAPRITPWAPRHGAMDFPLAVLPDRDHGSIIDPDSAGYSADPATQSLLGELILAALKCESFHDYTAMSRLNFDAARPPSWRHVIASKPSWADITEATAALAADEAERAAVFPSTASSDFFHQYLQVVVQVVDDHGAEVDDYFLEFFAPGVAGDAEAVYFQQKVIEDVHVFGPNGAYRCLFVDRTDLMDGYYSLIPATREKVLAMSLSATPPGDNVHYFRRPARGAAGELIVHRQEATDPTSRWLKRNCTHFVKIVIPRSPEDRVFKLSPAPAEKA